MLKRMLQFHYTKGTSNEAHLDEFNKFTMNLKNVDEILDDEK